ncbi:peptidoglycan DD-metalloendopeptidase family protein [Psychroflexus aestuariivivens]|uniref:peptidoglycan DD-metalloendopeptidase family protein n=1 Tax=Psychroflexus aestuariivivens TaxID=1795040 RepID=UPI000FD75591|nr:peptidoglycan DD-metalloendopeptidase family protein [Psychroflexus aestuariivivens]
MLTNLSDEFSSIFGKSVSEENYIQIDLSENQLIKLNIDPSDSDQLSNYITEFSKSNENKIPYGGYLEKRNLYQRSNHFSKNAVENRNIHLGLDFWANAETSVFLPYAGAVHSFANNKNLGDYGPTIIMKHEVLGDDFYSLYGHLSEDSISGLKVGDYFDKGTEIAKLGKYEVNGNYPPHLHFQLIVDLQNYYGDYPGVSTLFDLGYYRYNCPNPNLILNINNKTKL